MAERSQPGNEADLGTTFSLTDEQKAELETWEWAPPRTLVQEGSGTRHESPVWRRRSKVEQMPTRYGRQVLEPWTHTAPIMKGMAPSSNFKFSGGNSHQSTGRSYDVAVP
jgi:hypothetical protein